MASTRSSGPVGRAGARDAHWLTLRLLRELPDRAAHSVLAGLQAQRVCITVPVADAALLVSAALLHDIGYAAASRQTGFHPIDGANSC